MGKHDPQRFTDAGALPVEPEGFGPWYLAQRSDRELDEAGALCKARRTMELEVYRARLCGATYR